MNARVLSRVFVVALLTLAAAALSLGGRGAAADTPHPGLNFSIGIADRNGIDTCSSNSGNPCYLTSGVPVAINLYLDSSGLPGYAGYYALVDSSDPGFPGNLTLAHAWPQCGATFGPVIGPAVGPSAVEFGCFISPWNHLSTYTGKMAEFSYSCSTQGFSGGTWAIRLVPGTTGTRLVDGDGNPHSEGAPDQLNINCFPPPTGTPPASPPCDQTRGDVDNNGSADAVDAMFVLQYDAGLRTLACPGNGDINRDGRTNSADAALILRTLAGL